MWSVNIMGKVWLFRSYIALLLNLFPRYVPTSHVTGYCGIFSGSSRCSAFPEKSPERGSENLAYVRVRLGLEGFTLAVGASLSIIISKSWVPLI
uniref:Putative secreted protein n=1 Tax=Amblyomma triste TaxID=251400 RepID=A0A023G3V5_AMBTT